MPVGIVVSEPQELGEGLFLIQIQMDSGNPDKLKRYPAVTAHPAQFPVGSQATLKNVTANGQMTFNDAFHIAVKVRGGINKDTSMLPPMAIEPKFPEVLWNQSKAAMPAHQRY
jgi:hypothetical protein